MTNGIAEPITGEPTLTLLRLPEVCRRTGKKRTCIYRDISLGTFPAPVKLGERASAWLEHEIVGWICERVAARERAA